MGSRYQRSEPMGGITAGRKGFAIESNFSLRNLLMVLLQVLCLIASKHLAVAQGIGCLELAMGLRGGLIAGRSWQG